MLHSFGKERTAMKIDLSGVWELGLGEKKFKDTIELPGTTAYAKKGEPNKNRETYFLTEIYKFEGKAWYRKKVQLPKMSKKEFAGKHFFLTLERTRVSTVWVDGKKVETQNSFIAKHVYDLTGFITNEEPEITIQVSNVDYVAGGGHMTSQDTQTNWNGILGEISLEICDSLRINYANTACDYDDKKAIIETDISAFKKAKAQVKISADLCRLKENFLELDSDCSVWEERATTKQAHVTDIKLLEKYLNIKKNAIKEQVFDRDIEEGDDVLEFELELPKTVTEWDEEDPNVYRIKLQIFDKKENLLAEKILWFGYRKFEADGNHFVINDRKTFLRGRHQGMLFPLSGFAPMNVTGWLKDFKIAKDWGLNHERCHTCTPPEAAFIAADLLGFYFQPEIPFWGTWYGKKDEKYKENKKAQEFLAQEGFNILKEFAGHPSFVMMSMGNELWGDADSINELMGHYKAACPDILFTQGSNNFQWNPCIVENDDFFSGVRFDINRQIRGSYAQCDAPLGKIQKGKPATNWNYDEAIIPKATLGESANANSKSEIEIQFGTGVKKVEVSGGVKGVVPNIPVVSHEVGQYFTYPDFNEIHKYTGVLQARNLQVFQERLEDKSLSERAKSYHKSSGKLAMECYKQELEAASRSENMAGYQILDLQDFTGQGTALVGPLNGLMENKGLISAKEWRNFCNTTMVLGEFESYVLDNGSELAAQVKLVDYSKYCKDDLKLSIKLVDRSTDMVIAKKSKKINEIDESGLHNLGVYKFEIPESNYAESYRLQLLVLSGKEEVAANEYVFWSYPKLKKNKPTKNVVITDNLSDTLNAIDDGKDILLYIAPKDNRRSLPGAYCTDFWNYPMFRSISESMNKQWPVGTLGALIAQEHPALSEFPTEKFLTPQWFDIIERSRASILNTIGFRPIVTMIDNCERNDNLGIIYEFDVVDGKKGPSHVLVCTSPLPALIGEGNRPAMLLEKSMLKYLASDKDESSIRTNSSTIRRLFD